MFVEGRKGEAEAQERGVLVSIVRNRFPHTWCLPTTQFRHLTVSSGVWHFFAGPQLDVTGLKPRVSRHYPYVEAG